MRKLAFILFVFFTLNGFSQRTFDTTFTGVTWSTGDNPSTPYNARVTLPASFNPSGMDSFQLILFVPGLGEMNSVAADVYKNGPHRYIIQGWNGGISLSDRTIYPIIVSLQPPSSGQSRPKAMRPKIEAIISKYRIKRNSIHFTGLSQGGWSTTLYTGYMPTTTDSSWINTARSLVNVDGVTPTDTYGTEPASPQRYYPYTENGSRYLMLYNFGAGAVGGWMSAWSSSVNGNKANSVVYFQTTTDGSTGHGQWEKKYGGYGTIPSNYSMDGLSQNIYQWMVRQGDTVNAIGAGSGGNVAPVANAGTDQTITLPTDFVTLNGSLSSDDISITAYSWTRISGPNTPTFGTASAVSTTVTGMIAGTYVFRLTCTDGSAATGTDDITVTVNAAGNISPSSNAGTDQTITLPTSSVTLSGSGTDADGTIASYSWIKQSGGSATITSASSASTTVTGLAEGNYIFRLIVYDNLGASGFDEMTVTVNAGGSVASKYVRVNIYGGSNPYSNTEWFDWNTTASLTATNVNYSDASASTIDFSLGGQQAVSDNGAGFGGVIAPAQVLRYASYSTSFRDLVITGLDNAKTYNIELFASRANTGNTTRFTLNGNIVDLSSDNNITNSAKYNSISPTSNTITIRVDRVSGSYNYLNGFIVTENGSGGSNQSPTVNAGVDQTIDLPSNSVTVNGSANDPDGVISTYQWSKIAGPTSFSITSPNANSTTITGLVAGSYTFSLLVTDNLGATAADQVNINVTTNPINQPPTVNAGSDINLGTTNTTTSVNANASDDGSIVSYKITKTKFTGQRIYRVGILGSSTMAGSGATTFDSSVIGRFKKFYQASGINIIDTVYNTSAAGLIVYEAAPSSYTPPLSRPTYANGRNTTNIISRSPKPDIVIVSFPSNGYDIYTATEVCDVLRVIKNDLEANGIRTFISTTQPRPGFDAAGQAALKTLKDSIINRFGADSTLDFWSGITNPGTDDLLSHYSAGDNIHLNNSGHERLFQVLVAKNIFNGLESSTSIIQTPNASNSIISENPLGTSKYQVAVLDDKGLYGTDFIDITVSPVTVTPKQRVFLGEYQAFITDVNDVAYGFSNYAPTVGAGITSNTPAIPPIAVAVPYGTTFRDISSGLHHTLGCDNTDGSVWTWGWNDDGQKGDGTTSAGNITTPYKILIDSIGNAFNNVVDVETYYANNDYQGNLALKSDGTVWIWGNTRGGLRGNGSLGGDNYKPVQIPIPGGRTITKIQAGQVLMALASDGTVWSWGGNNSRTENLGTGGTTAFSVSQVQGLSGVTVVDISGGGEFSYALSNAGVLYGWGFYGSYLGVGTGGYENNDRIATARNLTTDLNLPLPIWKVVTNTVSTHVLLTDSTLWGWGDNAVGSIGNGQELNFAIYTENPSPYGGTIPKPYAWSIGAGQLLVQDPVQITSFHDFIEIYSGMSYVFNKFAQRLGGQLYSWGRNKTGTLGNGIIGPTSSIVADYPNSWDVPAATPVNPLGLTGYVIQTSPYCITNPTLGSCPTYTPPVVPITNGRFPAKKVRYKN